MVTYFNEKDLVNFGEYLLSEKRTNSVKAGYNKNDNISLEERLKGVYQTDIDNFKENESLKKHNAKVLGYKKS